MNKILEKVGEESIETTCSQERRPLNPESSDLIFHLLVLFAANNITLEEDELSTGTKNEKRLNKKRS